MQTKIIRNLALLLILIGTLLLAIYIFSTYGPKGGGSPLPQNNEIEIPDMPSFTLPISEIIKIEAEQVYFMKVNIANNVTLVGELKESVGMCINFYVLNESNMKNWLNNRVFSSYARAETIGSYNFTFIADHDGTYYFVFDNREFYVHAPCSTKVIIFNLKHR